MSHVQAPGDSRSRSGRGGPPSQEEIARHAAGSESTRLLCAGVYVDDSFRDTVIDELYVHQERCAAPSLGVDVGRVLAHALRARKLEGLSSLLVMALWAVLFSLARSLGVVLLIACLLLVAGAWIEGGPAGLFATDYPEGPVRPARRRAARTVRWTARFLLLSYAVSVVSAVLGKHPSLTSGGVLGLFVLVTGHIGKAAGWWALVVPVLMTAVIHLYGVVVARVLATELSPAPFAAGGDPVLGNAGAAFQRVAGLLRSEQHSQLIIYHERHPFLGAGTPREPWTLATELKREDGAPSGSLDIQKLIAKLTESVEKLKSPIVSVPAEARVHDRLSGLEVRECVFLQSTGLTGRDAVPRDRAAVEAERTDSMRLGGEVRRHFLRIHVGAWEEELVVTVFVRVHTQGGMLMVEFAPHILYPIRAGFRSADRVSHASRAAGLPVALLTAAVQTPAAAGRALLWALREALFRWRLLTGGARHVLPDGPWCSIRELGSASSASLFQEMDVSRYLKSVQDRVASGVRAALKDSGWRTDDFDRKIVNVGSGGVYIESTHHSAIGIGDNNTLNTTNFDKPGSPLATD